MKKFILLFIIALSSCSTTKKVTVKSAKPIFSEQEKQLILSGKENEPMRLYLIDNKSDSLLLRTSSQTFVVDTTNKVLQLFTKRLYATVTDPKHRGVGIAAPQVGILKRIIWVRRLDKKDSPFEVYYNPVITKYTEKKQDVPEGCLSIPNFRATTTDRAYAVFIQYDDYRGEHKCEMVEAFTAAIFQHEIDHLNGIMFIDHLMKEIKDSRHKIQ